MRSFKYLYYKILKEGFPIINLKKIKSKFFMNKMLKK